MYVIWLTTKLFIEQNVFSLALEIYTLIILNKCQIVRKPSHLFGGFASIVPTFPKLLAGCKLYRNVTRALSFFYK